MSQIRPTGKDNPLMTDKAQRCTPGGNAAVNRNLVRHPTIKSHIRRPLGAQRHILQYVGITVKRNRAVTTAIVAEFYRLSMGGRICQIQIVFQHNIIYSHSGSPIGVQKQAAFTANKERIFGCRNFCHLFRTACQRVPGICHVDMSTFSERHTLAA